MTWIAVSRSAAAARKSLLARKRDIAGQTARLRRGEDALPCGSTPDPLDRGVDLEPYDILERLQAAEARELAEIDSALLRLESGTYGQCDRCGGSIGVQRLRAVPQARSCMRCAAEP